MSGGSFEFKHQRILDVRERQQQALEMEIAKVDRAIAEQQERVDRWLQERRETLHQILNTRVSGDLAEGARATQYLYYVRNNLKRCRQQLDELRAGREEVRHRLEQTMLVRKALENYRDRMEQDFLMDQERSQERILDLHSLRKYAQIEEAS